jgi:hypothetical protein
MPRKFASTLITAAVILAPAAALAMPHGKPGLWNISSTMQMPNMPEMPPEMLAMMKKRGMNMPVAGQPIVSKICMTAEQAAMDHMPNMNREGVQCTPRVISQTSSSATTEMVCKGTMEGTGRSQINWRGDSHYEGTYSFNGSMHGQPNSMSTNYVGDWVSSDCGSIKPFTAKSIPAVRPPPPK